MQRLFHGPICLSRVLGCIKYGLLALPIWNIRNGISGVCFLYAKYLQCSGGNCVQPVPYQYVFRSRSIGVHFECRVLPLANCHGDA